MNASVGRGAGAARAEWLLSDIFTLADVPQIPPAPLHCIEYHKVAHASMQAANDA
ncbi:hypothetical protein K6W26_27620 [Burkholderia sp. AU42008]|uniref:hypothetical protein n=1 Tax=unclassified Burkholderia TaxID=2613784 RepID=UPI0015C5EA46|nr:MULTISPECIES: hypothetical protein [unclassified Burkholderia]MBR8234777.1 hypothetical protein [Burkholderia sp. AU32357]MBY4876828.1 hypothetical protein [Burkholderia sp. AU42008]